MAETNNQINRQYLELLFSQLSKKLDELRIDVRGEMRDLRDVIELQGRAIHTIELNTTQSITQIKEQIDNIKRDIEEEKNENERREIARQESDIGLGTRISALDNKFHTQEIINSSQAEKNENVKKRENRILTLQYGAIGTFITLALAYIFNIVFP
jgi:hypothetical protein